MHLSLLRTEKNIAFYKSPPDIKHLEAWKQVSSVSWESGTHVINKELKMFLSILPSLFADHLPKRSTAFVWHI